MSATIEHLYEVIKDSLQKNGYEVNPYRKMKEALQFIVFLEGQSGVVVLYYHQNKPDYHLHNIDKAPLKQHLQSLIDPLFKSMGRLLAFKPQSPDEPAILRKTIPKREPATLVGTVAVGEENYFGPLIVAGVLLTKKTRSLFKENNWAYDPTLSEAKLKQLAKLIKAQCPHSLVNMANHSYNEIYERLNNPYHMSAWGHYRVIENIRKQAQFEYVLSPSFGNKAVVDATLISQGKHITVYEKDNANKSLAVQAAQILAQHELNETFNKYKKSFQMTFPRGQEAAASKAAQTFYSLHDAELLGYVAKTHLPITKTLE